MEVSGIVNAHGNPRKIKSGKDAGKTSYSFAVKGINGFFSCYTNEPPAVGSYVEFETKRSATGFENIIWSTLKVTAPDEAAEEATEEEAAPAKARAATAYRGAANKDENITWQSARNAAIALAQVAATAGILDLGSGKKDSKLEALSIYVNQLTLDFFTHAMEVNATGEVPEDFQE